MRSMELLAPRDLSGITTTVLTTTAPAPTITATTTSTQSPIATQQPSNANSGPTSSPLLFIILITILGTALLIAIGLTAYCCLTRTSRRAARDTGAIPGNELQPQPQPQPPAAGQEGEVYGYYAPALTGNGGAKSEQEVAARELYGYFSPTVSPRVGDGVVARPGGG